MEGVGGDSGDGDGLPSPLQGEVERKMGCFAERKGRINGVQWREWRGSKGSGLQGVFGWRQISFAIVCFGLGRCIASR